MVYGLHVLGALAECTQRAWTVTNVARPPYSGQAIAPCNACVLPFCADVMFVGDSLIHYQFDALLAWLRRAGLPMRCKPVPDLTPANVSQQHARSFGRAARYEAIRELINVARYDSKSLDCFGAGNTIFMSRRMNLLPLPVESLERHLDALFSPLGGHAGGAVVVLNVGLHYGALSRHVAFASRTDSARSRKQESGSALAEALGLMHEGVAAFARIACARGSRWPHILWREQLPQHFPSNGGEYSASVARRAHRSRVRPAASAGRALQQETRSGGTPQPETRAEGSLRHSRTKHKHNRRSRYKQI